MKKLNQLETKEQFKEMTGMLEYVYGLKTLTKETYEALQELQSDGFYCVLEEDVFNTIPFEERWYTKYELTYKMCVLLLRYYNEGHQEVYDELIQALRMGLSKKFLGHGYDNHSTCLHYLIELYKNGLKNVIKNNYLHLSEEFNRLVYCYRKRHALKMTQEGFGDLKEQIETLLKLVDEDLLFVYGTLMDEECNSHYLDECPILGGAAIEGYTLLQLNGYPGMVKGNEEVIGEVYAINKQVKKELDLLEGPSYEYKSDFVYVGDTTFYAHFYEFKMESNKRYNKAYTNNGKWVNPNNYVWYVSYGSNLLEERFNKYIQRTTSKQLPVASKPIVIPYQLYFGKNSKRWNYQGVAFLDLNTKAATYAYMYLITKEQYEEIRDMEGRGWYNKEVRISTDELNIPILTITSEKRYLDTTPSKEYLEVIGAGLKQTWKLTDNAINDYLHADNLNYEVNNVKEIIKNK